MLSVIGGLTVMLGSSPLAAQATGATRSFDSSTVAPGGTVTVTITLTGADVFSTVTEELPPGFTYVSGSSSLADDQIVVTGQELEFVPLGDSEFTYMVTAPSTAGSYPFSGRLTISPTEGYDIDESSVTVSTDGTTPDPSPTPDDADDGLQFDVVPAKAVKGAVVSGLTRPIGSNPLQWEVETTATLVSIANDGVVGDFQVKDEGSGKFRLYVMNSEARALSGTQAISVAVTYDDGTTVNLTGAIKERTALAFDPADGAYSFTIPQGISANTPIGAFDVTGYIPGEYLDGIVTVDQTAGRSASETRT